MGIMEIIEFLNWFADQIDGYLNRIWFFPMLLLFDGILLTYCYIIVDKKVKKAIGWTSIFFFSGGIFGGMIAKYISPDLPFLLVFTGTGVLSCIIYYIITSITSALLVILVFVTGAALPIVLMSIFGPQEMIKSMGTIGLIVVAAIAISSGTANVVIGLKFRMWLAQYPFVHIIGSSTGGAIILGYLILWSDGASIVEMLEAVDAGFKILKNLENIFQGLLFLLIALSGMFSQSLMYLIIRKKGRSEASGLFAADEDLIMEIEM